MTDVFVVRNQLGHYWGKAKNWVDGSSPRAVLRTPYQDEAVNTLFELSSRDIELRGEVIATTLSERGEPVIEPSQIPLLSDERRRSMMPRYSIPRMSWNLNPWRMRKHCQTAQGLGTSALSGCHSRF
ncbi:MAG: hypothetical protein IPG64_03410 [Haliea sp.]|nr:hypothetical protein [Haliea sp.]